MSIKKDKKFTCTWIIYCLHNKKISYINIDRHNKFKIFNVIDKTDYVLQNNLMTINGNGPYPIKVILIKNTFSPNEYPNIKLITHIRFENKDVSYADTLYFGNDEKLYNCHGGK